MTRQRKNILRVSSPGNRLTPSSAARIKRKVPSKDETADSSDKDVENQVAAIKKLPRERIAVNKSEEKLAKVNARLRELLAENTKLTSIANAARKETEQLRRTAQKVSEEAEKAREIGRTSENRRIEADKKLQGLLLEIKDLRNQLTESEEKESQEEVFLVNPDRISTMITDFETSLSDSLSGMIVSNIELRLKVAVVSHKNRDDMLMIPPLHGTGIVSDNISELIIRAVPTTLQIESFYPVP